MDLKPLGTMACALWFTLLRTLLFVLGAFTCSAVAKPRIEYCISFWAKNITCYWKPLWGEDPGTTYTLHITEEAGRCRRDFGNTRSCVAAPREHSCGVPVENLFAFYKIKLTAQNKTVQTTSLERCIHGMSVVKLSAPQVSWVLANQSSCFQLEWTLSTGAVISPEEAQYQIQFRDSAETSWTQVNFTAAENAATFANVCGVFPFTNYTVQVRARYNHGAFLQSSFWSDWSPEKFTKTLPAVPSRGPALWRRFGPPVPDGSRVVVLLWKPLQPKEANGEILGYTLYSQREGEATVPQCLTRELQCSLLLSTKERITFLVEAHNRVGRSPPTKLTITPSDGQEAPPSLLPVLVSSSGDHALELQWPFPSFPKMSYVVEWRQLPTKRSNEFCWHYQPGNVGRMVITEAIDPGILYELKIFALRDTCVWATGTARGYSKQIAPRRAPALYPVRVWTSQVELRWELLPLEERGGLIQNYTLSYETEGVGDQTVVVLDSSVHRHIIKGLLADSDVRVDLTVANSGGRSRSPVLTIRTKSHDYEGAEIWVSLLCVTLSLSLLAGFLACLHKHQLLQKFLWPQIPNPAKSSLATWMPQNLCLDLPPLCPEKGHQDCITLNINNLSSFLPSPLEGPGRKTFLQNQWLVAVSSTRQKKAGTGKSPKFSPPWNEVEYSRVIIVPKTWDLDKSPRSPRHLGCLSKGQGAANLCSQTQNPRGIWVRNLTSDSRVAVGNCRKVLESLSEFPLLVRLVAIEHAQAAESPPLTPRKKT